MFLLWSLLEFLISIHVNAGRLIKLLTSVRLSTLTSATP